MDPGSIMEPVNEWISRFIFQQCTHESKVANAICFLLQYWIDIIETGGGILEHHRILHLVGIFVEWCRLTEEIGLGSGNRSQLLNSGYILQIISDQLVTELLFRHTHRCF